MTSYCVLLIGQVYDRHRFLAGLFFLGVNVAASLGQSLFYFWSVSIFNTFVMMYGVK
jgi:hypothetical protein